MGITKKIFSAEMWRFIKFGLTGVMNTLVDYTVFWMLLYSSVDIYLSQVVAYSCGMLNSYIVNRSWTFASKKNFFSVQMLRFILVNLSLLLISLTVLWLGSQLGYNKLIAKLGATAVTLLVGFVVNQFWVFNNQ
ncbi:MAG: GtrA family protein [Candidatus Fimivivens sp.]